MAPNVCREIAGAACDLTGATGTNGSPIVAIWPEIRPRGDFKKVRVKPEVLRLQGERLLIWGFLVVGAPTLKATPSIRVQFGRIEP